MTLMDSCAFRLHSVLGVRVEGFVKLNAWTPVPFAKTQCIKFWGVGSRDS
jgi:hypothetical protein